MEYSVTHRATNLSQDSRPHPTLGCADPGSHPRKARSTHVSADGLRHVEEHRSHRPAGCFESRVETAISKATPCRLRRFMRLHMLGTSANFEISSSRSPHSISHKSRSSCPYQTVSFNEETSRKLLAFSRIAISTNGILWNLQWLFSSDHAIVAFPIRPVGWTARSAPPLIHDLSSRKSSVGLWPRSWRIVGLRALVTSSFECPWGFLTLQCFHASPAPRKVLWPPCDLRIHATVTALSTTLISFHAECDVDDFTFGSPSPATFSRSTTASGITPDWTICNAPLEDQTASAD